MTADYRDALLHEDLITPLHDHDEARNSLVATVPGRAEAGRSPRAAPQRWRRSRRAARGLDGTPADVRGGGRAP